jgi:hypothetical protein
MICINKLIYLLLGLFSINLRGYSKYSCLNLERITGFPNGKNNTLEAVEYQPMKIIDQSSLLEKERLQSMHFEISHDRDSSNLHGISRIVERIDFQYQAAHSTGFEKNIHHRYHTGFFKIRNPFGDGDILFKNLYLPTRS